MRHTTLVSGDDCMISRRLISVHIHGQFVIRAFHYKRFTKKRFIALYRVNK